MMGPALLIMALAAVVGELVASQSLNLLSIGVRFGLGFFAILVAHSAGRLLGGAGSYAATLRGAGFGYTAYVFELLYLPPLSVGIAPLITLTLAFFGVWLGAAEAHRLQGWRSLALPAAIVLVFVAGTALLLLLGAGSVVTIGALLEDLGLIAQ
jgi:hypothetical protein